MFHVYGLTRPDVEHVLDSSLRGPQVRRTRPRRVPHQAAGPGDLRRDGRSRPHRRALPDRPGPPTRPRPPPPCKRGM
jgi:hypothetical protein